jgi:hypothetical protein
MNEQGNDASLGPRRLVAVLSAIGALVTGVFGWLGSLATIWAQPPVEAAVFLAASALAFGLLAIAAFRR